MYSSSLNNTPPTSPGSPMSTTSNVDNTQYSSTDVAIIGMACRVAGGNDTPERLWQSLLGSQDASGEIPSWRWAPYQRGDPRTEEAIQRITPRGYFLQHLDKFDAQFFGISPKEAEQMDPQQRLSLEIAWEALENGGIAASSLSGSDTAVFWGVNSNDYFQLLLQDLASVEPWMGIGTAYCGVPNRISYHLNLTGPSAAVDAACASSLVAVHQGCQSIISGESKMAIVGGVNAICGPGLTSILDKAGVLSPEGRCRSFDDAADGYGRGEGAAAVVLKNIHDAVRDGDDVLAVIKGTAVASNGKTEGIMAPNATSQAQVARKALRMANLAGLDIGYVEAHATATPLGDPTEIEALSAVYGDGRSVDKPCFVGSIKANVGHLEAGAGVVGLIKAVLTIRAGILAPQPNLQNLTTKVNWEASGLKVVQETTKWPATNCARRAAISSYGYGGVVSSAVIEQFIQAEEPPPAEMECAVVEPAVLLLSGHQDKRIHRQAQLLRDWMQSSRFRHDLGAISSTLALRRHHHCYRSAMVVDSNEDAVQALESLSKGNTNEASRWTTWGRVFGPEINKDVIWVFSGHGAQWAGMGRDLLRKDVFVRAISPLDKIVRSEIGVSPIALLRDGDFHSTDHIQILTYVMQIGISAVLRSYGITPRAILGHSVGEIAASVVAGALTPEEGIKIVTRRAILYRQVMGQGGMILVCKPYAEVAKELRGRVDLTAAIDASPSSCVVAGSVQAIGEAVEDFKQRSIKTFRVKSDTPFHSPMLKDLMKPLLHSLDGALSPSAPDKGVMLYSTSLHDPRGQDIRDPEYWVNNMMNPVRLTPAVRAAIEDSYRVFIEISSHPLILPSINETLMDAKIDEYCTVPTMKRGESSSKTLLSSISQLHCHGVPVDWASCTPRRWAKGLPNTSWMHRSAWRDVETRPVRLEQTHDRNSHTLLGKRVCIAGCETVLYTTRLDSDTRPFPGSHPVHETEIVPAACLVNTFLKATAANALQHIVLRVPVAISTPRAVQVVLHRGQAKIMSQLIEETGQGGGDAGNSSWTTHTTVRGWTTDRNQQAGARTADIPAIKARIRTRLADDFSIAYLEKMGVSAMGFPWIVTEHHGNANEMLARVDTAPCVEEGPVCPWDSSSWAPMLDAATSVASTIFFREPRLRMPAQIEMVEMLTQNDPPRVGWLHVLEADDAPFTIHANIFNEAGEILLRLTSMRFSEIDGTASVSGSMESLVHQVAWPPAPPAEEPMPISRVVLVSGRPNPVRDEYASTIPEHLTVLGAVDADELAELHMMGTFGRETAFVYIPGEVVSLQDVAQAAREFTWELLQILKFTVQGRLSCKVFALTTNASEGADTTALAHAPLMGLSRVLASEHPEVFGGLIDSEVRHFPIVTMRYIQCADIVRIRDGMPRTACLRPLTRPSLLPSKMASRLLPRPGGTYVITGGLGVLGLAVAEFLVENGARRLILVSRRPLPPRKDWHRAGEALAAVIGKINDMEAQGASVHALALDISSPNAKRDLSDALGRLDIPAVRGVVHAAGVLDDELAMTTTLPALSRVMAPKITGALALHELFPPRSIDFMILFSSCGQLVGFTGQSSYASANAFLDSLAAHRHDRGDNTVAFQWTAWRGMGMGSSSDFIGSELENKGITDITRDEAFEAWRHVSKYDTDHGVVLRSLTFNQGDALPSAIIRDIAPRRSEACSSNHSNTSGSPGGDLPVVPETPRNKSTYLDQTIRHCLAHVLHMAADDIDSKAALSDIGVDSVMAVSLRRQLQQTLKVNVPPTLTWSRPTVSHLVEWFMDKL
ncbi:hypothetical protein QQS21_005247 [Conoideocrella luteorostrata]|uniref:6-methylsalicylic acid synthase n=1 Tax=Conoideocrella luteorostrata TaxID=1105319 RepID=A0AAJ0FTZ3_9HYPO|nr:hypothetical protein QQS21_005247 [Conoideocrella luteorostrata]